MSEGSIPGRDTLVQEVASTLLHNPRVTAVAWEQYALVVRFHPHRVQLNGFAYDADGGFEPATPNGVDIHRRLQALREATCIPGREPWEACVVRLDRPTRKVTIEFEYDHPELWEVTPATAAEVAARARPGAAASAPGPGHPG